MYSFLVFIHVGSALFLGSFLSFPLILRSVFSCSDNELKPTLRTILSFTRTCHYALVLLMISGIFMFFTYSQSLSTLWITIAILLVVNIGGMIGRIQLSLKKILLSNSPEKQLIEQSSRLQWSSWITFLSIIAAVFIMTNRYLFT
ncbi:hypothetical protein [Robertmurraya sp. Marseille-Q9965]